MAVYQVTAPNGKKYRIKGEGTAEEALAHFQQRYQSTVDPAEVDPSSSEFQAKYGPTAGMGAGERFLAGAGKAFTDIGRGAGQLMGLTSTEDVQASRERDVPLMQSKAALAGNITGGIAAAAPAMLIPGAGTVAGAAAIGGAYGALQPTTLTKERLANVGIGAATGGAAQAIGNKVSGYVGQRIANRVARAETARAQNVVRDTTLADARRAGYVVPPSTTNPTVFNRWAESISGKAQTQQAAAFRNQHVTSRLIRSDLGLPQNTPLTRETLQGVRQQAGQAYRAMKAAGEVVADDDYLDDLARLTQSVDEIAKDFPDANLGAGKEINDLVDSLMRDKFQVSSAVEYTKKLRAASTANYANRADPTRLALATAQRDASGALEDMVIRHLNATGKGNLAKQFDDARRLIAKTYSVEGALNESTGMINTAALARELKRGKPLTGGIELAARVGQAFPKAAAEVRDSPGVSAVDAIIASLGAVAIDPTVATLPLARYGARAGILSRGYQAAMGTPSYTPGVGVLKGIQAGAQNAALPAIVVAQYPKD